MKTRYTKANYIKRLTKGLEHRAEWVSKISARIKAMTAKQVREEMTILYGKEE